MTKPKINPPLNETGKLIEGLSFVGIIAYIAFAIYYFSQLPVKIPSHFNIKGEPDAWFGKETFIALPFVALCIYLFFTYLNSKPYLYNFPQKITEENAEQQYRSAKMMLSVLKCIIVFAFFFISWRTVLISQGKADGLGPWFLVLLVTLVFGSIGYYYKTSKEK